MVSGRERGEKIMAEMKVKEKAERERDIMTERGQIKIVKKAREKKIE